MILKDFEVKVLKEFLKNYLEGSDLELSDSHFSVLRCGR